MKRLAGLMLLMATALGLLPTAQASQVLVRNEGEFAFASFPQFVMNDDGDVAFLVEGSNSTKIYTVRPGAEPQLYAAAGSGEAIGVIREIFHFANDGTVLFSGLFRAEDGSGFYPGLFRGPNIDPTGNLGGDTIHDCLNGRCDQNQTTYLDADYEPGTVIFIQSANQQPQLNYRSEAFCSREFNLCFLEFNGDRGLLKAELTPGNDIIWIDGGFSNQVKRFNLVSDEFGTPEPIDFPANRAIFDRQGRILFDEPDVPPSVFRRSLAGVTTPLYDLTNLTAPGPVLDESLNNFTAGPGERVLFSIEATVGPEEERLEVFYGGARLDLPLIAEGHLFEGELLERLAGPRDGALDRFGRTVVSARWGSTRGLILADGGTDFPAPAGEAFFWSEPLGGNFGVASHWEPEEIPSENDVAVFDLDAVYDVATAGQTIGQLKFDRGSVAVSGDLQLTSSNLNAPSVQVGFSESSNPDGTELVWLSGQVLTVNTEVEGRAGQTALLTGTPGMRWINQNLTSISNGLMSVQLGASFSSGSIRVGDLGSIRMCGQEQSATLMAGELTLNQQAFIDIVDNASLETGTAIIGQGASAGDEFSLIDLRASVAGSESFCSLGAGSSWAPPDWSVDGDLFVGVSGDGLLRITDGASVSVTGLMAMAVNSTSTGEVVLRGEAEGLGLPSTLIVEGFLTVGSDGGTATLAVQFPEAPNDLAVQPLQVSEDLFINGGSGQALLRCSGNPDLGLPAHLMDIQDALFVGGRSNSLLDASDCLLTSSGGFVGASVFDDVGTVTLRRSVWRTGRDGVPSVLNIGLTDSQDPDLIRSRGEVTLVEFAALESVGTINIGSGGVLDLEQGIIDASEPVNVTGRGTLRVGLDTIVAQKGPAAGNSITGDLNMSGGRLEIRVDESGDFGRLTVNGNVDLSNTEIRLVFPIGYAPSQGDLRTLVDVSDTVNATGLTLSYTGIERGFEYAVTVNGNGELEFEALNDGVPFLSDVIFESDFEVSSE